MTRWDWRCAKPAAGSYRDKMEVWVAVFLEYGYGVGDDDWMIGWMDRTLLMDERTRDG